MDDSKDKQKPKQHQQKGQPAQPKEKKQQQQQQQPKGGKAKAAGGKCGCEGAITTTATPSATLKWPLANDLDLSTLPPEVKYIDSHAHLDLTLDAWNRKEGKEGKGIFSLQQFGEFKNLHFPPSLESIIHVCCFMEEFEPTLHLVNNFDFVYATYGIHPHEANKYNDLVELTISKRMADPKTVAWGEMGLDFYYNNSAHDVQRKVFARQLQKAKEVGKPIVIHSRDAEEDTLSLLKQFAPQDSNIHLHCWGSSNKEFAKDLLTEFPNLFIGFTGAITFKTAEATREIVDLVPLDRMLLETDSPYMAPGKYRGQTSHSGQLPITALQVAKIKNVDVAQVLEVTRQNTKKMYKLL